MSGYTPLRVVGKRLNATKEQVAVPYANHLTEIVKRASAYRMLDNRLKVHIDVQSQPVLNFRIRGKLDLPPNHHITGYCDQLYQFTITIENLGQVPVNTLRMSTDQPELVSLCRPGEDKNEAVVPCRTQFPSTTPSADGKLPLVHVVEGFVLSPGQEMR